MCTYIYVYVYVYQHYPYDEIHAIYLSLEFIEHVIRLKLIGRVEFQSTKPKHEACVKKWKQGIEVKFVYCNPFFPYRDFLVNTWRVFLSNLQVSKRDPGNTNDMMNTSACFTNWVKALKLGRLSWWQLAVFFCVSQFCMLLFFFCKLFFFSFPQPRKEVAMVAQNHEIIGTVTQ